MSRSQPLSMIAAGDAIVTHRLDHLVGSDARVTQLADAIHAVDVATVNLEVNVFDAREFAGWPAAQSGGGYLVGSPACLDDLAGFGFNLFARGNNHAMDFGIEGLTATDRCVTAAGVLAAGTGRHLADAARAVYLETTAGRVAMISLATTFPVSSKAGEQRHDAPGRPGVNGVTIERQLRLPGDVHAVLSTVGADYGRPTLWREANLDLAVGDTPELVAAPNERDVARIVRSIEVAAAFADFVVVNGHSHEPSNPVVEVPDWYQQLARRCVDAGANAFIGHGPHQLRGVEIYRGRPICYSLGNFICQRDAHDPIPADQYQAIGLDPAATAPHEYVASRDSRSILLNMTEACWYQSALPRLEFVDGELAAGTMLPIDLDAGAPPGRRGIPRAATDEQGAEILGRLSELSAPFGTTIDPVSGVVTW